MPQLNSSTRTIEWNDDFKVAVIAGCEVTLDNRGWPRDVVSVSRDALTPLPGKIYI
jgi:hypothetical protein